MMQSDVEGAREHILTALNKYEVFAVLVAGLSVMGYLARELLHLGVASPRIIVIAFGNALRNAFEPVSLSGLPENEDGLGRLH